MKELKNEIITFRTTKTVKEKLEEEAEARGTSISQLAERIIGNFVSDEETTARDENEELDLRIIFKYINETDCQSMTELVNYCLENELSDTLQLTFAIWKDIIDERKRRKE